MANYALDFYSREVFLKLVNEAGLSLSAANLGELERLGVLLPLTLEDDTEGRAQFCALHLYVIARYMEHVKVYHHPWQASPGKQSLSSPRQVAQRVQTIVSSLCAKNTAGTGSHSSELANLALELERFIFSMDPFGPFNHLIDIVRADVIVKLRGVGRLYAELRRTAMVIAELAEATDVATRHDRLNFSTKSIPALEKQTQERPSHSDDIRSTQVISIEKP